MSVELYFKDTLEKVREINDFLKDLKLSDYPYVDLDKEVGKADEVIAVFESYKAYLYEMAEKEGA